MIQPELLHFAGDGRFPNSDLPVVLYRGVLRPDPDGMEQAFAANGWSNAWRDGIFAYHHFHSTAHEVLAIAQGEVQVMFGGPSGRTAAVRAGDVVVIPAGVGHCNLGQGSDLLVIGAYPGGAECDIRRGDPGELRAAQRSIAAVPAPACDPVFGRDGPLRRLWTVPAGPGRPE